MISQNATAKKNVRLNQPMPLAGLKLRRPCGATPGNPDDYDVFDGKRAIGRIFSSSASQGRE
jgi:hypothetical protein